MEHAIGTHITLEVVECTEGCEGCAFENMLNCPSDWKCYKHGRKDHKNIIYKEIKED